MATIPVLALCLDLVCFALVLGATVFFFFVQSPKLLLFMGREKFVTVQMKITEWFFLYIQFPLIIMVIISSLFFTNEIPISSAVAAVAGFINYAVITPQALKAGKASVAERRGKDSEGSLKNFAVEGAATSTKFWHQTVVLFVVIMTVGLLAHIFLIVSELTTPILVE